MGFCVVLGSSYPSGAFSWDYLFCKFAINESHQQEDETVWDLSINWFRSVIGHLHIAIGYQTHIAPDASAWFRFAPASSQHRICSLSPYNRYVFGESVDD